MRETLYRKLISYRDSDYYGFHMPGHKRNMMLTEAGLPYDIDITEIEGFDDLHHVKGILKQAQERAARIYGAEETFYLINGSTCGILSAIMGCTQKGDKILMARNCHKSAYHAAFLNELSVEYVYPQYLNEYELNGSIRAEDVERILREDVQSGKCVQSREYVPKETRVLDGKSGVMRESQDRNGRIRAVVIVSPTYDGVVSDVEGIAKVVHEYDIPLIVDEAHGAHFVFHPYFPQNSNLRGADVVIHSLHKTLPSLTQTALLHMNGNIVKREEVRRYLHIFQSSSPSYVLMASMDECMDLLEREGKALFDSYVEKVEWARIKLKKMRCLHLVELPDMRFDFSKFVVSAKGTGKSGKWLYQRLLDEYHLQMEMAAGSYVIAMTSVGDTKEGMERLVKALLEIDGQLWQNRNVGDVPSFEGDFELPRPEQIYSSAEAVSVFLDKQKKCGKENHHSENGQEKNVKCLVWEACEGQISAEYAYLYPPGIPLLVPGERISQDVIKMLKMYRSLNFDIEGLSREGKLIVL